jgi:hypothetical protein
MTRSFLFSTIAFLMLGGLLWAGLTTPAQGQTLTDVIRYSEHLPASGGPVAGRAGAGLSAGIAAS